MGFDAGAQCCPHLDHNAGVNVYFDCCENTEAPSAAPTSSPSSSPSSGPTVYVAPTAGPTPPKADDDGDYSDDYDDYERRGGGGDDNNGIVLMTIVFTMLIIGVFVTVQHLQKCKQVHHADTPAERVMVMEKIQRKMMEELPLRVAEALAQLQALQEGGEGGVPGPRGESVRRGQNFVKHNSEKSLVKHNNSDASLHFGADAGPGSGAGPGADRPDLERRPTLRDVGDGPESGPRGGGMTSSTRTRTAESPEFLEVKEQLLESGDLERVQVFKDAGIKDFAPLVEKMDVEMFRPGDKICTEGEEGHTFYVIRSGNVNVLQGGNKLCQLGAHDTFGEVALLHDHAKRTSTVVAATDVMTLTLSRDGFTAMFGDGDGGGKSLRAVRSMSNLMEQRLLTDRVRNAKRRGSLTGGGGADDGPTKRKSRRKGKSRRPSISSSGGGANAPFVMSASKALREAKEIRERLGKFAPNQEAQARAKNKFKRAMGKLRGTLGVAKTHAITQIAAEEARKAKQKKNSLKRANSSAWDHGGEEGREKRRRARQRAMARKQERAKKKEQRKSRRGTIVADDGVTAGPSQSDLMAKAVAEQEEGEPQEDADT